MKIGIYPVVGDILHTGHLLAIEECKRHCDYLIVALHCCPNYKSPVQTIYERFIQLRSVKWVDEVIPYTDVKDARTMLSSLKYDIYFLGDDHKNKPFECDDVLRDLNKEIFYIPRNHSFSSTELKERMIKKDIIDEDDDV